jgi:hypothetical protein
MVYEPTKRLFGVRIHPESAPHIIVALLATSESEAESIARGRAGFLDESDAPVTVRECPPEDEAILVTFK